MAVCVLGLLLIAPTAATAAWLPAVDLSEESEFFGFDTEPQVAVDASGGALAIWAQLEDHYRIQASTKLTGGSWGPPVDISPPNEESVEPRVAMNGAGQAVAAWVHLASRLTIKVASRTPQGNWGAAEELFVAGGAPNHVDVAIGPAGEAVVIWTGYQDTSEYIVRAAFRSPEGEWGSPIELSEAGNSAWNPKVAIDPAGNVVAAWSRWTDDGDAIIQVAEKKPGQAWDQAEDLSAEGGIAWTPEVEVSAERAVVVWQRQQIIEASTRDAGGAWQPAVKLSPSESQEPALAMDGEGNAFALWSSGPALGLRNAEVASLPVGGSWAEPITIAERLVAEGGPPQIAVDPIGRAMAIWTAWDGTTREVEAASGAIGGSWSRPVPISPPNSWSRGAQVAMDSAGNAAAVWRATDTWTTKGAFFDITRPGLGSLSIPSQARAGRPVSFGASPFDAWSPLGPVSWSFGDGSIASGPSVVHSFQGAGKFNVTVRVTDAAGLSTTASGAVDVTPALAVVDGVVRVRNGRARVKLHCPGTAVCRGGVVLSRQVKSRKGRRVARVIGQTELAIPGGAHMTVAIKLDLKSVKFRGNARRKGVHAQVTGDGVEPRAVVLKPFTPRAKSGRMRAGSLRPSSG